MNTTSLPVLLPLPEAAQKYGVSVARLKSLVKNGTIKAAMMKDKTLVVNEEDVRAKTLLRKEDLPEYKKHAHLKGIKIGVGEGARKYNIPATTLHGWAAKGIVSVLGRSGQKVLLNEADVAYCAEIYHQRRGQGKWVFDKKNGLPYKPQTGSLGK